MRARDVARIPLNGQDNNRCRTVTRTAVNPSGLLALSIRHPSPANLVSPVSHVFESVLGTCQYVGVGNSTAPPWGLRQHLRAFASPPWPPTASSPPCGAWPARREVKLFLSFADGSLGVVRWMTHQNPQDQQSFLIRHFREASRVPWLPLPDPGEGVFPEPRLLGGPRAMTES